MIVDVRAGDDRDQPIAAAREPRPEPHTHIDLLAGHEGVLWRRESRLTGRDVQAAFREELEQDAWIGDRLLEPHSSHHFDFPVPVDIVAGTARPAQLPSDDHNRATVAATVRRVEDLVVGADGCLWLAIEDQPALVYDRDSGAQD